MQNAQSQLNPVLRRVLDETMRLFEADARVLAAYMSGSVGTAHEDAYSDVDPVLVVEAAAFESFDRDLPDLFRRVGVEPVVWWPERINCDTIRNYAVLFERDDALLQYDITFHVPSEAGRKRVLKSQVLFDKAGVLDPVDDGARPRFSPDRLRWHVEIFWIYAYIHAKYLRRGDAFKVVAAQQELFQAHLVMVHALKPDAEQNWWPILANEVCSPDDRETLLGYLRHTSVQAVADALPEQMARFARVARAACDKWNVTYPDALEHAVRTHIQRALDSALREEPRRT